MKQIETGPGIRIGNDMIPPFLYGTAWKEDDTARCVQDALRAGFRGIDTANQRKHYHEAGVGEALRAALSDGQIRREELFIQTKFTFPAGQDHRLPYDLGAPVAAQVRQPFSSSLEHLGVDYLDSFVIHGPATPWGIADEDREAWSAMASLLKEGRTRFLGVSNVNMPQLRFFSELSGTPPAFVQIRCFARAGWDRDIRAYCREQKILYQGFSLLTANREIFRLPRFQEIVRRTGKTPAQIVFRFAIQTGILPLTGTTNPEHMAEDLESQRFELSAADVNTIENIGVAG